MNIKKIYIFDFDGTLIDTGTPDKNKLIWKSKTGEEWKYKGWWSKEDSLNTDVFDFKPIDKTIAYYEKVSHEPDSLLVMMTGRINKLSKQVIDILNKFNLNFDEYYFNEGGSTLSSKIKQIGDLLKKYNDVEEVYIFEDRDEHIEEFKKFGDKLISNNLLKKFKVVKI